MNSERYGGITRKWSAYAGVCYMAMESHPVVLQAALGRPQAALEDFSRAIAYDRSVAACFDAR